MISTKKLENAAREIEKTGELKLVITIDKKAIDKCSLVLDFAEIFEVESQALGILAWKIIRTYLKMKREGRLQ